ncbi:MAG: rRNA pseudouridine synthase [Gammaproteobacteria bacterium]|nr:rRNA pseudouridine synthase [Gammaproteobacteria bacterium]
MPKLTPTSYKPAAKPALVSLARVLSKLGVASRTVAAGMIEAGRVAVDGRVVTDPELRIDMGKNRVEVDGKPLAAPQKRYLAVNKPRGLVTTASDEQGRATVYECLRSESAWLVPVGRLDKASEGLILFTNDTAWAQHILDPASHVPKTYHVQVDRLFSKADLVRLREGVTLEDGTLVRAAQAYLLRSGEKNCWLEIVLHEGINRQIRRMIDALDATVLRLVRVAIGPVELGSLPKGQSRPLTEQELRGLSLRKR